MNSERFKKLFVRWRGIVLGTAIVLFVLKLMADAPRIEQTLHAFGYAIPFNTPAIFSALVDPLALISAFLEVSLFVWLIYVMDGSNALGSGGGIAAMIAASAAVFGYQAFIMNDVGLGLVIFLIFGFMMIAISGELFGFSYKMGEFFYSRFPESMIACSIAGYGVANTFAFGLAAGVITTLAGCVCLIIGGVLGVIAEYLEEQWQLYATIKIHNMRRRVDSMFKWLVAK